MKIRFLRDFQSRHTHEQFYRAGEEADLDYGADIIAEGAAVEVLSPPPPPAVEAEPEPKKKASR